MTLHLPTLMLALMLGFLLLTLQLGISQQGVRARPELRRWNLGSWAFLAGLLCLVARQVVWLELSIVLGNALLCLGIVAYVQAVWLLLRDRPAPRVFLLLQPLVWLALVLMLDLPLHRRTAVLSLIYAALIVPAVWVIACHGWRAERSLRAVALSMSAAALAFLLRAVHAWLTPDD